MGRKEKEAFLLRYRGARYVVMRDGIETAYQTWVSGYSHEWNEHTAIRINFGNRKVGEEFFADGYRWKLITKLY